MEKGEGGPRRRSEVVTIRLDPRLKYLAEISARKQRRTLSGYIEWAVEQSLANVHLDDRNSSTSVAEVEHDHHLWDVNEAERITTLALLYPELLTYEEQLIWRVIRDCGLVWRGSYSGPSGQWSWSVTKKNLILDRVRMHWDTFKKVADGELPRDRIPQWNQTRQALGAPNTSAADIIDDDIPF